MEIEEKEEEKTGFFKTLYYFLKDPLYNYSLALIVFLGILGSFIKSIDSDIIVNSFIFWFGKYVLLVTVLKGAAAFFRYIFRGELLDLFGFIKFLVLTAILAVFCVLGIKGILVSFCEKTSYFAICTLIPTLYLCCKRISTGVLLKYQSMAVKIYVISMIILFILNGLTLLNVFDRYGMMLSGILSLPSIFVLLHSKEENNIKKKNKKIDKLEIIFICLALIIGCMFCLNKSFDEVRDINLEILNIGEENSLVMVKINYIPTENQTIKIVSGVQDLRTGEGLIIEAYA